MTELEVKEMQRKLNKVLGLSLVVDGDCGKFTTYAIKAFQKNNGLVVDGIPGPKTMRALNELYHAEYRPSKYKLLENMTFAVFVDAGHAGIDENGEYVTPGKRAYHKGEDLHNGGHYYEGLENRIAAERFILELTKAGIPAIRTYHPYKDTPLSERTEIVRSYLKRGYYGYMHSFHSNAISSKNSKEKLESTIGFMVFSTKGDNHSDKIAQAHFDHTEESVHDWVLREQKKHDRDSDFEVNFQILRETDLKTFPYFGAILEEWGFHTSAKDCRFITSPKGRRVRVEVALKTAKWAKNYFEELIKK